MYGIGGETDLTEATLDHLSGYRDSQPVRIGNGAYDQQQHDVWGMLLDSLAAHARRGGAVPEHIWTGIANLVDQAVAGAAEPDQGIWEMRGEPKHFVASKVMCWVAADRGAQLAASRSDDERAASWQKAADAIKADVLQHGLDERGVFVQHYDTTDLDASNLLIPIMGFLAPDDERVRATVLATADELTQDGLVLRYRVDSADDGLSNDQEGTFTICSFWLVSALAMIGETTRARALFEKLLSFAGPLHLYAEEIDAESGQHLGNYPQAFTHLALIDAALRLIDAKSDMSDTSQVSGSLRKILLPLALAQFICSFAGSNMNVMITDISDDLDTTVQGVQVAITVFLLVMAAFMIPGGKLTDRWGRKRCFTLGLMVYAVGALLSAAAPGLGVLIVGNSILEGLGTCLLIPPVYILTTMFFHDLDLTRPCVRHHHRHGRRGRRRRTAHRWAHHHRDQLAGGVRVPGHRDRSDPLAEPLDDRSGRRPTRRGRSTCPARSCPPPASCWS